MMAEAEIKSWLSQLLKEEKLNNLNVKILGKTDQGDGYLSDIVFTYASGTAEDGSLKEYNLALKCSKRNEALLKDERFKESFINEIYVYDQLFPFLREFQNHHGVENIFNHAPKCYGTFSEEKLQVIALQNLKKSGYDLWPRKQPLTRKHIDLVMEAYGKFHATSIALKHQQPEKFQEIIKTLRNNLKTMYNDRSSAMSNNFKACIEEAYDLLRGDLSEEILIKWKSLSDQVVPVFESTRDVSGMRAILHGDCWNNNFMYKYDNVDKSVPSEVLILDWQMSISSTPICDLSYFLFCCISEQDIEDLDDILRGYYKHFSTHLKGLGVQDDLYPLEQFLDDWKKYCKYGIILFSLLSKIALVEKEDAVDVAAAAESGKTFGETFTTEVKDKDAYKKRLRYVVAYSVKQNLI